MSSLRRILASRANGARSRGPVSAAGKQASARNSLRHGLLAQTVVLVGEDSQRFADLAESVVNEFQPVTESEMAAVDLMIVARWRHLRTLAIQKSELDFEMAQLEGSPAVRAAQAFRTLGENGRSLDLVNRYETCYERQYYRALKNFFQLEAQRPHQTEPYAPISLATGTFQQEMDEKHTEFPNEPSPISERSPESPDSTIDSSAPLPNYGGLKDLSKA